MARARAGLPAKLASPRPAGRRKPSLPAMAQGGSAARQDVLRRGEETSVGYCAEDGPAVTQEYINSSSTDLHNVLKHKSVM